MKAASGSTPAWAPVPVRAGHILVPVLCALWVVAVIWAIANGPRLLAATEQQAAIEMEQENQDVCERLGVPLSSERYAACAAELKGVRQNHEDRLNGHATSLI